MWDSTIISTTAERIEDCLHVDMEMLDKLGLAAYLLTLLRQDVWDTAESYIASRDAADAKDDIKMSPSTLCLSMFKEWYPQDGGKITAITNLIDPMKRMVDIHCSKLYDCS